MPQDRAFEDVFDLLYAAPSHPELWNDVLSALVDAVGADSGWMARLVDAGEGGEGQTCRLDPSAQATYFAHFERLDPFRDRRSQPLGLFDDEAYLPKASLTRSEFYNDFMRPLDAHSILKLRLFHDGRSSFVVHLNRSRKRGAFDRGPVGAATRLFPHLARATRLHAALRDGERAARLGRDIPRDAARDVLAGSLRPTMLLDAAGRVHAANAAAEALLDEGEVLTTRDGVLVAASAAAGRRLEDLLAQLVAQPGGQAGARAGARAVIEAGRPGTGWTIPLDRGRRRLPLLLTVARLGGTPAARPAEAPMLLLTIGDPDERRRPHPSLLAEMFRLTAAEGRVALKMMEGLSIQAIAAKAAISEHTARNHVRTIFAKTGVSRQGELVALLMRIASAL